ncbi:MAG: hypothetical protein WDW36_006938 [Sanguina aurantia]
MPPTRVHMVTSEFLSFMTPAAGNLYLVALNYTLPRPTLRLWSTASYRICADGGANRLFDEMGTLLPLKLSNGAHQDTGRLRSSTPPAAAASMPAPRSPAHHTSSSSSSSGAGSAPACPAPRHPLRPAPVFSSLTAAALDVMAPSLDPNPDPHPHHSAPDAQAAHPPTTPGAGSVPRDVALQEGASAAAAAAPEQVPFTCVPPPPSEEPTCGSDASDVDSRSGGGFPGAGSSSVLGGGGGTHVSVQQHGSQGQQQQQQQQQQGLLLPDLIQGDMDSIRADVLEYYTRHGVPHRDLRSDQDSTDLMKCLHYIEDELLKGDPEPTRHTVLVLGAIGGRLDHTLSNLGVLHMFPSLGIVLWGDGNLGPKCGLVPIAGGVTATTTGLKWDCDRLQLRVGGLLSTSNELAGGDVSVEVDGPVLWMTEVSDQAVMSAA